RDGQKIELDIPPGFVGQLNRNKLEGFSLVRFPLIVDDVSKKSKITNGTMQKGDVVIGFNGSPTPYNTDFYPFIENYKDKPLKFKLLSNNRTDTVSAEVYFDKDGKTNVGFQPMDEVLGTKHITYSFLQSIPAGFNKCWSTLGKYITNLRQIFTSKEIKARDSLG